MLRRILDFLRLGSSHNPVPAMEPTPPSPQQNLALQAEEDRNREGNKTQTQLYFTAMAALQQAVTDRDYEQARHHALEALEYVTSFVDETLLDGHAFNIQSIPPLEIGGLVFAMLDDRVGIERIRTVTALRDQLANWKDIYNEHEESRAIFRAIERVVAARPGVLQNTLKQEVGAKDGRRIRTLVDWLEKAGEIKRESSGKTYALFISAGPKASTTLPRTKLQVVGSHRRGGTLRKRMVDWSTVTHIPLPRSPSRWELDPRDCREDALTEPFKILDSQEWGVLGIEKLPPVERPDPAFRKLYATLNGILALDDLAKSDPRAKAVAMRYGRGGKIEAKGSLAHEIYRIGVSPMSGSLIGLSRTNVVHVYDDQLRLILETDLAKAPEIVTLQRRLGIDASQLHRYIRSVALSNDARRYLFTAVDEAWCVGFDGIGVWGLGLPLQDGYRLQKEGVIGTQENIQHALDTLGLALPLAANDIKQRYRVLAKEWHPDVNPSPSADTRMQEINYAMSLLTGLQEDALAGYSGVRIAYKEMGSTVISAEGVDVPISFGMSMSEAHAADWLYASAFGADLGRAFVATYSGKVLELNDFGEPVRYYSIGNVPRRIIDTENYLYLLTHTRLYVLRNGALVSLIDISKGGDIVVAQRGLGILEKKRFRWFDESGALSATVLSKDPVRLVYQAPEGMILETRTHRLRVGGGRPWWR